MQNILLAAVLIAGLITGYFVGNYRGKSAQETLMQAITKGESLNKILTEANTNLKRDLIDIENKRKFELEENRKKFEVRNAEWLADKANLKEKIKTLRGELNDSGQKIDNLRTQLASAPTIEDKNRLEYELEQEKKKYQDVKIKFEGEKCREVLVPQSVLDILKTN